MSKSASFSLAFATLGRAVKYINTHDAAASSLLTIKDSIATNADGDYIPEQTQSIKEMQTLIASPLNSEEILSLLQPFIDDVWFFIDGLATTPGGKLIEIRDYMKAQTLTVEERELSIGSITASGPGELHIVEVDKHGSPLQGAIPEAFKLVCIKARGTGASRNQEVFEYRGVTAAKDASEVIGSGLKREIAALYDSQNIIQNPRFSSFNDGQPTTGADVDATSLTSFASWLLDNASNFSATADNLARRSSSQAGSTTDNSKGLKFKANGSFSQRLLARGQQFDPERPYLPAAYCYKPSGADGAALMGWGSKSQSFTVSSEIPNDDFAWLTPDLDVDLYFDQWEEDDPLLDLTLSGAATFGLQVIEYGFFPGIMINGYWWFLLGHDVPFKRGDQFSATISQLSDGVNQRVISQKGIPEGTFEFPFSFPSASSPSEADQ